MNIKPKKDTVAFARLKILLSWLSIDDAIIVSEKQPIDSRMYLYIGYL